MSSNRCAEDLGCGWATALPLLPRLQDAEPSNSQMKKVAQPKELAIGGSPRFRAFVADFCVLVVCLLADPTPPVSTPCSSQANGDRPAPPDRDERTGPRRFRPEVRATRRIGYTDPYVSVAGAGQSPDGAVRPVATKRRWHQMRKRRNGETLLAWHGF